MPQQISNEEFNIASNDIDNKKILNKASRRFVRWIPAKEMCNIKLIALWKSLQKFDPTLGRKFSSYLYQMTNYECMNWITQDKKTKIKYSSKKILARHKEEWELFGLGFSRFMYKETNYDEFNDMVSILPPSLANIVKLRIVHGLSLEEIGKEFNFSHETARRRLSSAYKILKSYNEN